MANSTLYNACSYRLLLKKIPKWIVTRLTDYNKHIHQEDSGVARIGHLHILKFSLLY